MTKWEVGYRNKDGTLLAISEVEAYDYSGALLEAAVADAKWIEPTWKGPIVRIKIKVARTF